MSIGKPVICVDSEGIEPQSRLVEKEAVPFSQRCSEFLKIPRVEVEDAEAP